MAPVEKYISWIYLDNHIIWEVLNNSNFVRLVNLIDVTLTCEDVNSMLVVVVKVADVDAKKRVDDSLVQTWKMKFSHKINFLSRLWAQGLVKIEVEVQAQFWSWSLVNILLLILGWDYEDYSW